MLKTSVFVIIVFASCSAPSSALAQQQCFGAFSESCSVETLQNGNSLGALCGDGQGGFLSTSLNLDQHITNTNGNLQCSLSGGGFSQSCSSASVSSSGTLSAECLDAVGNLRSTQLDLDNCVENRSGTLSWACLSNY